MIKNYLLALFLHAQASLVDFQKTAKQWAFRVGGLTLAAILMIVLGIAFKNVHVVFVGSLLSAIVFILSYWTGVALTDTLDGAAKMVPIKDKDAAKKRDEAVAKVAAGLTRLSKLFLTVAMILSFISTWSIAFGFHSFQLGLIEIAVMTSITFSIFSFYKKKETVFPQWIIGILTIWACLSYFSTLDTPLSRALAIRMHNQTIGMEKNSDSKATAVIISDAVLYHINGNGNLEEMTDYTGTKLEIGSVVRIKETQRFEDELFTKVVIPNANGSYARGTKAYVQTEVLSSSKKLTVFPNAANPQYAMQKTRENGKEVWKVYFLTDEPISFPVKRGKIYTFSGVNSGDIWATKSGAAGLEAGQFANSLKAGVRYRNVSDDVFTLMAKKGTALTITWSNG
jgi:hypothetical protein